jgi:TrmH family RNA methyltransferase
MIEQMGPRNPLVQQAKLLAQDRKERATQNRAVLEGVRLAEEALAAGVAIEYALVTERLSERERGERLLADLRSAGVELHLCKENALERAADTQSPQGIVAVFRPRTWDLADLGDGPILLLDNLQDPGNLGTIIRSMDAFSAGGLVISGGVDPFNPKVIRSAMGGLFRLPVILADAEKALRQLKAQGRSVYIADAHGELTPWAADLSRGPVIVIGNEGAGPAPEIIPLADGVISIPMSGLTESLNAGVAASLLLFESIRQRTNQGRLPANP